MATTLSIFQALPSVDTNVSPVGLNLYELIPSLGHGTLYPTLYQSYSGDSLALICRRYRNGSIHEWVVLKASRHGTGFYDGMYIRELSEALEALKLQGRRNWTRSAYPMLTSKGEILPS